ncbi:PREDICTED: uncharacterized protein LOC105565247 [Vollenhovia emeryi]|uniref:uncharacterized protein LOC105565247 n=1 Tax=Vollenhovia emeryi TaxID=411798 RepID=UPI0005F3D6CF|nr:PREDICTED: uncharacterized protein LOC105565247 [Vollenhovia emeryi]XP_011873669.1 PREDICTED: uncharacterized protein LOC105565247 [Vollenhovia emeryi]
MVNTCCVCGKEYNHNESRTFHSFPKNPDLKQKWFDAIGKVVKYSARICSDHFSQDDFNRYTRERKRLLPSAIPCKQNRSNPVRREMNEQISEHYKGKTHLDIVFHEQHSCDTNAIIGNNSSQTSIKSDVDISNSNPDDGSIATKNHTSYSCIDEKPCTFPSKFNDQNGPSTTTIRKRQLGVYDKNILRKRICLDLPNNEVAAFTRSNFTSDEAWNTFVRSTVHIRQKRKILVQKCRRLQKSLSVRKFVRVSWK